MRVWNEESFTFEEVATPPLRRGEGGRASQYLWHRWLDGRKWLLTRGVDFDCTLSTFRGLVSNQAARRMIRIQVRKVKGEEAIVIQKVGVRLF